MEYQPKHARRNRNMERIHLTIKTVIWCCIAITAMLLVDWFSREVIMNLPW